MITILTIIKRLFSSNKVSFIITAIVMLCATTSSNSKIALSNGNYTYLLAIMTPFIFVFYDYTKLIHLGTSKKDYFLGCLASYGLMSLIVSLANTTFHVLVDSLNHTQTVINIMDLCGWRVNGVFIAFLQQATFLLLVMIFLHILLSMQSYWYGWLTDGVLIAIICIFTPTTSLRHLLVGFFEVIMFNSNAFFHIGICLLLCVALSLIGLTVLKRKTL